MIKLIPRPANFQFALGQYVKRKRGNWHGVVVGFYSTELTPEGYCVMSLREYGCVHVEPERMLEAWDGESE